MLQQTQVSTVVPYYVRWMERFPTVQTLAEAELEQVLEHWAGLGYYSRARNLHRCARMVCERFAGAFPRGRNELRLLPGVGTYTSGAVASIAFGEPVPAVDGNVRRVLSRLFDLEDPSPGELEELASAALDPGRPGDFNQALMELGATICTPRSPACGACPVEEDCLALGAGTVAERPVPRRRAKPREERFVSLVLVDESGHTLLGKRPESGLLGGLWEFPGIPVDDVERAIGRLRLRSRRLTEDAAAGVERSADAVTLPPVAHRFTHIQAEYHPVLIRGSVSRARAEDLLAAVAGDRPVPASVELRRTPLAELEGQAVPVAQLKIADRALRSLGDQLQPSRARPESPNRPGSTARRSG